MGVDMKTKTTAGRKTVPAKGAASSSSGGIRRRTTVELVVEELRSQITGGVIGDGEAIHQERIASELGVSRIPLREAMRQLEAEGLITITSHRGGVVSTLSRDQIRELFEIRSCLEPWLLELAIPCMTEADFCALEAVIDKVRSGEQEQWGELNWEFHEALYVPAAHPQTIQMLQRIHCNLHRYLRLQISATSGWDKAKNDHQALVAACRTGDVKRATALLQIHIMNAADELDKVLTERQSARS